MKCFLGFWILTLKQFRLNFALNSINSFSLSILQYASSTKYRGEGQHVPYRWDVILSPSFVDVDVGTGRPVLRLMDDGCKDRQRGARKVCRTADKSGNFTQMGNFPFLSPRGGCGTPSNFTITIGYRKRSSTILRCLHIDSPIDKVQHRL